MKNIIIALDDVLNLDDAVTLVKKLGDKVYAFKIHNLYDKFGPEVVQTLKEAGAEKVWIDYKLYDIPNTTKLRVGDIKGDIVSVHASGGIKMLQEASLSHKKIFAVTLLTSFSADEVKQIYNREIEEAVLVLARIAKTAGVSGIVCSPQELKILRANTEFKDLKLIVPGIRSAGVDTHDQNRVSTPNEAIKNGADYLVIGRQITKAKDPVAAFLNIQKELG